MLLTTGYLLVVTNYLLRTAGYLLVTYYPCKVQLKLAEAHAALGDLQEAVEAHQTALKCFSDETNPKVTAACCWHSPKGTETKSCTFQ